MCSGVPQSIAAAPRKNSRSVWKTNVLWASARVKNFIVQFSLSVESTTSSDQGHGAGRVMRTGRGALAPALGREAAGQAGDGGGLQRLVIAHGRQQVGKALGQHGLARTRRPHQQQVVAD